MLNWPLMCKFVCEGQWTFGPKRGGLLIMAHPFSSYIPHDTILKHRAKIETLKDRFLVTEVFTCPAYCLYLSNGSECLCMLDSILIIHFV